MAAYAARVRFPPIPAISAAMAAFDPKQTSGVAILNINKSRRCSGIDPIARGCLAAIRLHCRPYGAATHSASVDILRHAAFDVAKLGGKRIMLLSIQTASELVDSASSAVRSNPDTFHETLDGLHAPIYVTDDQGTITYFNKACVELAGRTPELGHDKWCVTWKLFTTGGELLPHHACPMAVAIRERRAVRDVEAIAERPDGTRVYFVPFPTPYFDAGGNMAGAVNLLLEIDPERRADFLRQQAGNCRCLAGFAADPVVAESFNVMATAYEARALRLANVRIASS